MVRFFANPKDISGSLIRLSVEDAEHIRALRLRPFEQFLVCDGAGTDHLCRLSNKYGDGESVPLSPSILPLPVAEIIETFPSQGEPSINCIVFIAFAKGDRLDYAVQKSVELGARGITLFPSERCVSIPGDIKKKTARLQRISLETAKQCGRGRIPEISAADSFVAAIDLAVCSELSLFLYECEDKLHLKQALERCGIVRAVSIVTGPEGGFEPFEAEYAHSAGMIPVTLGPRILRCETAPIAALAALMFHTGNM